MKKLLLFGMLFAMACTAKKTAVETYISDSEIAGIQKSLLDRYGETFRQRIERGVAEAARYWTAAQGTPDEFRTFCMQEFVADSSARDSLFEALSRGLSVVNGYMGMMKQQLEFPMHVDGMPFGAMDQRFAAFDASTHLQADLAASKIAHTLALNFPYYTLDEKNEAGKNWTRREWAYARMGDIQFYDAAIPAEYNREMSQQATNTELYISNYNICMGHLLTDDGRRLFPEDMVLLSHWNLRDQIKSDYALGKEGVEKQQMVYRVMERIIDQTIPQEAINNPAYDWNPNQNTLTQNGETVQGTPETARRYQQIIDAFHCFQKVDPYYPEAMNDAIKRNFNGSMEVSQPEVERLFTEFLSSPQTRKVAALVAERLGRPLQPYDIWYDGFKSRSTLDQDALTAQTSKRYPTAAAFQQAIPEILGGLGFTPDRARYFADRIAVDPARGSGHAMESPMIGEKARLRTRVGKAGMDYKGFNIAVHELGHNVEQTITLYDMDAYTLRGVPNTAFTEALAFTFQMRDLQILGVKSPENRQNEVYDTFWSLYEIMGVSMVDMQMWKWLYGHPKATAEELRDAVIGIAKEVWNNYYAEAFGVKDSPILAIYSHMISYPLYLSAYAYGHLIEFQLSEYLRDKTPAQFAVEIERIFRQGRLTPDHWMQGAVGNKVSPQPILDAIN